jgi:hypothetical protein
MFEPSLFVLLHQKPGLADGFEVALAPTVDLGRQQYGAILLDRRREEQPSILFEFDLGLPAAHSLVLPSTAGMGRLLPL